MVLIAAERYCRSRKPSIASASLGFCKRRLSTTSAVPNRRSTRKKRRRVSRSEESDASAPPARRLARSGERGTASGTRDAICAAARALLASGGAARVTMRSIAKRVGITPMAIYRHFRTRDDLLDALAADGFVQLESYLRRSRAESTAERRIIALLDRFLDFALDHPRRFGVMFLLPVRRLNRFPEDFRKEKSATFKLMADEVAECMRSRVFSRVDVLETTLSIWASAIGLVSLHHAGRFRGRNAVFRPIYRRALKRIVEGFRS